MSSRQVINSRLELVEQLEQLPRLPGSPERGVIHTGAVNDEGNADFNKAVAHWLEEYGGTLCELERRREGLSVTGSIAPHDDLELLDLEQGAMTPAEFRCLREYLGLTPVWLAERFNVRERTVHRWQDGYAAVPEGIAAELEEIAERTDAFVDQLAEGKAEGDVLLTYRTDDGYRAAGHHTFPASWHRAASQRAADKAGLVLMYADRVEGEKSAEPSGADVPLFREPEV